MTNAGGVANNTGVEMTITSNITISILEKAINPAHALQQHHHYNHYQSDWFPHPQKEKDRISAHLSVTYQQD